MMLRLTMGQGMRYVTICGNVRPKHRDRIGYRITSVRSAHCTLLKRAKALSRYLMPSHKNNMPAVIYKGAAKKVYIGSVP